MRAIAVLVGKDFSILLKDRASIVLTFIVPFALIYLFGQIFGVNQPNEGPSGLPLGVVNLSDNPAAARLVDALRAEKAFRVVTTVDLPGGRTRPLAEADLTALIRAGIFHFALVLPRDLVSSGRLGLHLALYSDPQNEVETQTVNGLLRQAIFSHAPQLLMQALRERAAAAIGQARYDQFNATIARAAASAFGGDPVEIERRMAAGDYLAPAPAGGTGGTGDVLARLVRVDAVQVAGADVKSPAATRIVGGWAIQFLLFAVTASATALFREKEQGIFQRVLAAPVRRADILWSKFAYGTLLGLGQLLILFTAGRILYGIDLSGQLGRLALVCVLAAAACTSFGMLIAAVSPTPEAARGLATFVILLTSAIGGAWFPVSFMPEFIQKLSRLTLVYWSVHGFIQVLWAHASLAELLPTLGALALFTALLLGVALWRFSRGHIFD